MPDQDFTRRNFITAFAASSLVGCYGKESHVNESIAVVKTRQYVQQHPNLSLKKKEMLLRLAPEVGRDYTTAPVRIHHRRRVYEVPANFFAITGRTLFKEHLMPGKECYEINKPVEVLGNWFFFWPDCGGYSLDNWFDEFDKRIIEYRFLRLNPSNYQKSTKEAFEFLRATKQIEAKPSVEHHGLHGYRRINRADYVWIGARANGRVFMMFGYHPEIADGRGGETNPQCDVRLYESVSDGQEDIAYHYSLDHFGSWREIDQKTQAVIQSWRVA